LSQYGNEIVMSSESSVSIPMVYIYVYP